ncbi:MAG: hypothetical protein LUE11_06890 [Clostridia bacterium]|nr:hypothetical protein [Clostridia bacterium]
MVTFLQGCLVGAVAVIGGFCVYLKLWTIRQENIAARHREAENRRKVEKAKAARNAENMRQIGGIGNE